MKYFIIIKKNVIRLFILLICVTFFACEKKIIDLIPVIQIEKDLSIPTALPIKHFDLPESQTIYAGSDTNIIYKSVNGGQNWEETEVVSSDYKCNGIAFINTDYGLCLMDNRLYKTSDAGVSWSYEMNAKFIGKYADTAIVLNCGYSDCDMYTSVDSGKSFQLQKSIYTGAKFLRAKLSGGKLAIFTEDTFFDNYTYGYDLKADSSLKFEFGNLTAGQTPTDIYFLGASGIFVGSNVILEYSYDKYRNSYDWESSRSFNSVDGMDGLVVAVGNKTIVSNLDIATDYKWNEVYTTEGESFKESFYQIKFTSTDRFYLSGDNGLLYLIKL